MIAIMFYQQNGSVKSTLGPIDVQSIRATDSRIHVKVGPVWAELAVGAKDGGWWVNGERWDHFEVTSV